MTVISVPQDFPTIQRAVDQAAVIGQPVTIRVAPGSYVEEVVIPLGLNDLSIEGAGPDRTRLFAPIPFTGIGFSMLNGNAGIRISGFYFEDFLVGVQTMFTVNTVLSDLEFVGLAEAIALFADLGTHLRQIAARENGTAVNAFFPFSLLLEDSLFTGNVIGASPGGGAGVTVRNTRFMDTAEIALRISTNSIALVENNRFERNGLGYSESDNNQSVIRDNTAVRNAQTGIRSDFSSGTKVLNNETNRNGEPGILLADGTGHLVEENESNRNGGGGLRLIRVTDSTVRNNELRNNRVADLIVVGGANNAFVNNDCRTSVPPGMC